MKGIIFFILFTMLTISTVFGQIKIGDNPQNIDPSSVLELESTSKVLVITRVTTLEMEAITPQRGGMVYNIDTECINYYDGIQWINLCDAVNFTITNDPIINNRVTIEITPTAGGYNLEIAKDGILGDNIVDGGIGPDDIQDNSITQEKLAAESVGSSEIRQNAVGSDEIRDGSIAPTDMANYIPGQVLITDENGIVQWSEAGNLQGAVGDEITLTGSGTPASPLQITDGIQQNISNNTTLIANHINDDADIDDTNELIDLTFTKLTNTLSISQSATPVGASVDLSALVGSDDQQLTLNNNFLTLEEGGTAIDLTTYLDNTDEQNLGTATLANEQLTINIQNGNPTTANLSAFATDAVVTSGLALKENIANKNPDINLGNSNVDYPTQNAVKVYVDNVVGGSAQTIVSAAANNSITPNAIDGGAFYNDLDGSATNEIQNIEEVLIQGNNAGLNPILGLNVSADPTSAATRGYVDANLGGTQDLTDVLGNGNSAGNSQIKDLLDPTLAQDAATKAYVDTNAGITTLTNGTILVGFTGDVPAEVTVGGDATMNNLGQLTIMAEAITPAKIEPGATDEVLTTDINGDVVWATINGGGTDNQNASEVPYDPTTSGLTAINTQAAIDELAGSTLVNTDNQSATAVPFTPVGNTTSTDVQAAITELQTDIDGITITGETNTASNQGTAGIASFIQKNGVDLEFRSVNAGSNKVTVSEDAINNEILVDIDDTNLTITESQISDLTHTVNTDNQNAAAVPFIPAGNTASTDVQAAITELQTDIDGITITGETNTASNQGTAGIASFIQKNGVDLEFRSVNAGSNKVTVSEDAINNEILVDIDDTNLTITESQISDLTHTVNTDNQNAAAVPFIPAGNTASTDVQAAITELQTDIDGITITGETNTASNQGTAGIASFIQKNGVDLEFRSVNAGSNKVTVSEDAINNEILVDIDDTNLTITESQISDLTHTVNTDNQNAAAVPFIPAGNTASTDVQAAIVEIQTEIDNLTVGDNLSNADLTLTVNRVHQLAGFNLSFDGPGNIGIGSNNPQNKLHVAGAIRAEGILNSDGAPDGSEPSYRFSGDSNTGMWSPAGDELSFSAGGQEVLRLSESVGNGLEIIAEGSLELTEQLLDENGSPGNAGEVLTATTTGTEWKSPQIIAMGKANGANSININGIQSISGGAGVNTVNFVSARIDADYIIQLTVEGNNRIYVTSQTVNGFTVEIRNAITDNLATTNWFFTVSDF